MQPYSSALTAAHLARQFPKVGTEQIAIDAVKLNRIERKMFRVVEAAQLKKIGEETYKRQMKDLGLQAVPIIEANYPGLKIVPGGDGAARFMAIAGFDNSICKGGMYFIDNRPGVGEPKF